MFYFKGVILWQPNNFHIKNIKLTKILFKYSEAALIECQCTRFHYYRIGQLWICKFVKCAVKCFFISIKEALPTATTTVDEVQCIAEGSSVRAWIIHPMKCVATPGTPFLSSTVLMAFILEGRADFKIRCQNRTAQNYMQFLKVLIMHMYNNWQTRCSLGLFYIKAHNSFI